MLGRELRLVGLAPVLLATLLGAACETNDCVGQESLVVPFDADCPTAEKAQEVFSNARQGDATVDGLAGSRLLEAVTLCWYRVQRSVEDCADHPTREELAAQAAPPTGRTTSYVFSCDEEGLLYGAPILTAVKTASEAEEAAAVECPATVEPQDGASPGLELGELVGNDFFPPQKLCTYDTSFYCGRGWAPSDEPG